MYRKAFYRMNFIVLDTIFYRKALELTKTHHILQNTLDEL